MPENAFKRELAGLNARELARPGWSDINLFKQAFFWRALVTLSLYSSGAAVISYLYLLHFIPRALKELHISFLYVFIIMGGLRISGRLDRGKTIQVLTGLFMLQLFKCMFYANLQVDIIGQTILGLWLIAWWLWKEPEMLRDFGIRRDSLWMDLLIACALSGLCVAYAMSGILFFHLPLTFETLKFFDALSGYLIVTIPTMGFFFLVWKTARRHGATPQQSFAIHLIMILILTAPTIAVYTLAGAVKPEMALIGLIANTLIMLLIMSLTFQRMRNSLAGAFLLTAQRIISILLGISE